VLLVRLAFRARQDLREHLGHQVLRETLVIRDNRVHLDSQVNLGYRVRKVLKEMQVQWDQQEELVKLAFPEQVVTLGNLVRQAHRAALGRLEHRVNLDSKVLRVRLDLLVKVVRKERKVTPAKLDQLVRQDQLA